METASLRIKFTPLVQDWKNNNSKCCLEIVPEVTCIQNLEKIEWHQKSEFIEYTIPMTYKVILRKRQGAKESRHDLEKVYHSCVDLLPTSSSTCISLGGGDNIMRMISDTLIYDSFRATLGTEIEFAKNENTELKSITNSKENENVKDKQVNDNVVMLGKFRNESSTENIISMNNSSVTKVDVSTSQLLSNNFNTLNEDSIDKIVSTSCSKIHLYKDSKTEDDETVTEASTVTGSNKADSLRKLSVTPIYSIEMIENEVDQPIPFLSPYPTLSNVFKPQKNINDTVKIQELVDNNEEQNKSSKFFNRTEYYSTDDNSFRAYKRELPEVRVASFIKKMETEIMPLKIMLHDILQKCSTMGLIMNESFRLKEHPITNKQLIKYCTSEKQTKCNRVVYSIVFDG